MSFIIAAFFLIFGFLQLRDWFSSDRVQYAVYGYCSLVAGLLALAYGVFGAA